MYYKRIGWSFIILLVISIITPILLQSECKVFGNATVDNLGRKVTVDWVIERYQDALGGKPRLDQIKTEIIKGTATDVTSGKTYSYERYEKAPNKVVTSIMMPGFFYKQSGFDGQYGWTIDSFNGVRDVKGKALEEMRLNSQLHKSFKRTYPDIMLKGIEKRGKNKTYVLESNLSGKHNKWYFDIQSGLLLSESVEKQTENGTELTVSEYKDFRIVSGIKTPFLFSAIHRGTKIKTQKLIIKFKEVQYNSPVNDYLFKKPLKFIADLEFIWHSAGKVRFGRNHLPF